MDSYSSYNTSTCSSSTNHFSRAKEAQPSYHSALHSIRKPKLMMKKPIAPLPPTPPKIYQVEPSNFKQVVQKLTSIPEFQPRRLKDMAPPPLNLLQSATAMSNDHIYCDKTKDQFVTLPTSFSDHFGTLTPTLSPASLAWCSFLIQSPGNVSTLDQGTVL